MRPAAILLTLEDDPRETRELVHSLGYDVVEVVQQNRGRPDPQTFLGRGKVEEAAGLVADHGARLVVVDGDLKPGQIFHIENVLRDRLEAAGRLEEVEQRANARADADHPDGPAPTDHDHVRGLRGLHRSWEGAGEGRGDPASAEGSRGAGGRGDQGDGGPAPAHQRSGEAGLPPLNPEEGAFEVADRVRVILEIFRRRAGTREARLQVELAKLRYEMPIVREAIHLSKTGERPGFLAGGQHAVERIHERMGKRMSRIRRELDRISDERELRRKHRRRGGFHLVSLAGYTNAGKSSLLTALTEDTAEVEDRVFTTLTTQTRRVESERRDILLTDTVGFIDDLPPWLVEAFHSTLEEIALADVILLVVDASDPPAEVERKLASSLKTLHGFASRRLEVENGGTTGGGGGRGGGSAVGRRGGGGGRSVGPVADQGEVGRTEGAAGAGGATDGGPQGGDGVDEPDGSSGSTTTGWGSWGDGVGLAPVLVVLNKEDRLREDELEHVVERLQRGDLLLGPWVVTSAMDETGLQDLHDRVLELLPDYDEYVVEVPQSSAAESFVAWVHDNADVREMDRGERVRLRFQARPRDGASIMERLRSLDAVVVEGPGEVQGGDGGGGGGGGDGGG